MAAEMPEALRAFYAAWQAGERDLARHFAPDCEYRPDPARPSDAPYTGHDGVNAYFAEMDEIWQRFEFAPTRAEEPAAGTWLVRGRFRALGRTSGFEVDQEVAVVWRLRDGLLWRGASFYDVDAARRAVAAGWE